MQRGERRDPTKEEFWRRKMREQARSGLSIRAWCREHDLHEHSFYWWRVRLARSGRGGKVRSTKPTPFAARQGQAFVPVRVSSQGLSGTEGQIEIVLSGERCVRVIGPVDRQRLADVLATLEAPPC